MLKRISPILLIAVLSGCAGIPTSSDVKYGDDVNADSTSQFVRVIARPPVTGMDQKSLIQGFLDACADSSDNFAIAREYLAPAITTSWKPNAGISIYEGAGLDLALNGDRITGSAPKLGDVTAAGRYEVASVDTRISENFTTAKNEAGEWRISDLSDGIILSAGDVERSYRSFPVYFFNPELTDLVTDSVLVPVGSAGAATTLVRALLNGPSNYLVSATKNAFPAGTSLSYGSVPIDGGQAQVDLSPEVLMADQVARRALSAQLVWTLSSLPNVSSVRITVSGQPLALTSIGKVQTLEDWKEFTPSENTDATALNVIRSNQIVKLGDSNSEIQVAGGSLPLASAAQNLQGNRIAAATSDGSAVLVTESGGSTLTVSARGKQISRPTWDTSNNILFADFGAGVFEITPAGEIRRVAIDVSSLGQDSQVKQVSVARDGVRVAVVLNSGTSDVLALGSIVRTDTDARIVGLHRIERSLTTIRDLDWKSQSSVVVLGSDTSGIDQLFNVSLMDGKEIVVLAPTGAQSLAVDNRGKIAVSTNDQTNQSVFRQEFGEWKVVSAGLVAYFSK